MTAQFFGEPWDVPAVEHARRVVTPTGEPCYDCGEPIEPGDRGWVRPYVRLQSGATPRPIHAECDLRSIMGHQLGICSCTGYETNRATARAVWAAAGRMAENGRAASSDPAERTVRP